MAREYETQILSHNSIYGEKIKENHYGRNVTCYYALPEKGINQDTSVLVLIAGFGGTAKNNVYRKMRTQFADQYNLVTLQCDYFGSEFMGNGTPIKNVDRTFLENVFSAQDLDRIYETGQLNFETMMHLGSKKSEEISLSIPEKMDEDKENFNDMGIMQALDHIVCTTMLIKQLKEKEGNLDPKKIIFYGHSHGAYVAYLSNVLAPHFISTIIDNAACLRPVYLEDNRVLTFQRGKMTCSVVFDYLTKKIYDQQVMDLTYLYDRFDNACQILCYQSEDDKIVNNKEKRYFCEYIENSTYYEIDEYQVKNGVFNSTKHSDADYLKLFEKVMEQDIQDKKMFTSPQNLSIETDQAIYVIAYKDELPYLRIKKKTLGLEIAKLRRLLLVGKLKEFNECLLVCLTYLEEKSKSFTSMQLNIFNECMQNLSFALQDQDYLLVTDILKFEIVFHLMGEENDD